MFFNVSISQFSRSGVSDSVIPWTATFQASMSITNSQSLLKLKSIESVMPSNHFILCCPFSSCIQPFPASGSFPMSQFFSSGGQGIGASTSVLPMNIQDWFPLGWTGWISLPVQGTLKSLLQHHSSKAPIIWCSAFFIVQHSHPYMTTWKDITFTRWTFVGKVTSLLFNMLSRLVIALLPSSKCLLISWLQLLSALILESKKIKWHLCVNWCNHARYGMDW